MNSGEGKMHLLIKFPTRGRPDIFRKTLARYYDLLSDNTAYQFVVSMDRDDATMNNQEMWTFLAAMPNLSFTYGHSTCKIEAINADVGTFQWDILLLASDDMIPQVKGYDEVIRDQMQKHFPDLDGCLHFPDGLRPDGLITLPVMGRKLYDQWGYVYHPSYRSNFCDNEYTDVVNAEGKVAHLGQVIIKHEWTNITKCDELWKRNMERSQWIEDNNNYLRRKSER